MIPVVTPVGRPNVGKSTLFNRLTRTRDAPVVDFPGLTRGRKYGQAEVEGREFICIDTSGIDSTEEGVETRMVEQPLLAIEEADMVLSMIDARAGLTPADTAITEHLCSREKPTFLVVNKTDGIDVDQAIAGFWFSGLDDICPIAASHGRDVISLLEQALLPWVGEISLQEEVDEDAGYWAKSEAEQSDEVEEEPEDGFNPQDPPIKLATIGRPNVGRLTLANRIFDKSRMVIYDVPGTTRDSIHILMQRDEREYVLIDTAGARKRGKITDVVEKFLVIKTLQAIEDVNVVLLVIDACEGISDQDLSLLGSIFNSGRSLVIVVNKWDGLSQEVEEQVKETLDYRLGFIDSARVHLISTLHGSGVGNLSESVCEACDSATCRVNIAMLTRIMSMVAKNHQPSLVRGRRVKLKYAHAGGHNPPIVVIHGNQVKDLSDFHKRYLMNYFRKSLDVMGTSIRVQFKEGENPFADKCNTLTPNQMRKRRRLIKHIKRSR